MLRREVGAGRVGHRREEDRRGGEGERRKSVDLFPSLLEGRTRCKGGGAEELPSFFGAVWVPQLDRRWEEGEK